MDPVVDFIDGLLARSEKVDEHKPKVEVVVAGECPTISKRTCCLVCSKKFSATQAVLVLSGMDWMTDVAFTQYFHRACIEAVLAVGPVDVEVATSRFVEYRAKLVEQYSTV